MIHALVRKSAWCLAAWLLVACGESAPPDDADPTPKVSPKDAGPAPNASLDAAVPSAECGDEVDEWAEGLTHTGDNGLNVTLQNSDPAIPVRGDNSWVFEMKDDADEPLTGVADATSVTPRMPAHGHGTSVIARVEEEDDAIYRMDPINLFMPGVWEVGISVETSDFTDSVTFSVCIQ